MLTVYSKETTSFSTLGIGVLRDFLSNPLITEELNGAYTLEFQYAKDGYLSEYLIEQNIIKANGQAFRIWNIKKDMQKITVFAKHIFFDLSFNFLSDVYPKNLTAQSAFAWLLNHAAVSTNFSVTGNCTAVASGRYVRKTFIDAIFNEDNALVKKFGGELSYDNFNITVHEQRGSNANFSIRYKKNLTGIDFNLDFSNVATRIVPIGFDGLTIDSTYVESSRASNYFTPLYKTYEFSDIKYDPDDEEAYHTLAEAKQALTDAANELFNKDIDLPQISIGINFVELSKCTEYENYSNLETVHLGDTIKVIIPELNIDTTARVNKTVYDCILKRFIKLDIGSAKQSVTRSQINVENQIKKSENFLTQAQQNAENLINHPFNGNIIIDKENGILYLMDTTDPSTAQSVWKWSLGGLGYSSTGINGTYTVAILQDGRINADFITTGQLNTGVIQGYDSLLIQVDTLDREFQKEINPTDTTTGSSISLEDSAEAELIDFELEGKTTQETRSGKNLFNYNETYSTPSRSTVDSDGWITATYDNSDGSSNIYCNYYTAVPSNITIKPNTSYTIFLEVKSISSISGDYIALSNNDANFIPKSTINSVYLRDLSANTTYRYGLTTKDDLTGVTGLLRTYVAVAPGSSVTFTYRLSLLKGSVTLEDFDYEPFGVMPSPGYPSELVSVGYENLFSGLVKGIGLNSTTGAETTSNTNATSDYIPVNFQENSNYYLSGLTNTIRSYVAAYNSNKQFLGRTGGTRTTQWDLISTSFTSGTPQGSGDIAYLRVTQYEGSGDTGTIDDIDNLTIQLEKGNQQHSYIPYGKYGIEIKASDNNNTTKTYLYTLDQPLRNIGDTKDLLYIKNGMLYVERKIGTAVLNGTEAGWGISNTGTPNYFYRYRYLANVGTKGSHHYFSNYFKYASVGNTDTNEGMYITSSNELRLRFGTEMTLANFKNWLSTHNTEVQYILAEPYTEEIGQVDIPSTYKGVTHIDTTDELEPNMSITYVRDTQISNYVEQHISEIKVNEQGITQRVESIENNGLEDRVSAVETNQSADRYTIDIISQNITYKYDESGKPISSEINSVKTSRGFTFDDNGLDISTGENSFHTTIDEDSTDYKDGNTIVSTTSKDGSALRMLRMLEQNYYSYNDSNPDNILDTSNYDFIDERVEVDGEYAYATFYNGED